MSRASFNVHIKHQNAEKTIGDSVLNLVSSISAGIFTHNGAKKNKKIIQRAADLQAGTPVC